MTLLISVQSISKSFGMDALFQDISFSVYQGDKLGLIGPNGSGKSTLLKIMMGMEEADSGKIAPNRNKKYTYLAQADSFNPEQTIRDALFTELNYPLSEAECRQKIREVAGDAVFPDLEQTVGTLSGGWRKRLAVVQALLQKPNLLLMDEPTNHLDLEGILWLESLLKKATFSFLLVSHDRVFLENTVNAIMEINRAYVEGYLKSTGNYTQFVKKREDVIAEQLKNEHTLANKMRREQEWLQRGPKARTTKAQYRIDNAEKLREDLDKFSHSNAQHKTAGIDFDATHRKTKVLLETHQLKISRNGKLLFENLNLKLAPGSCLGLIGQNGSGKSSLLNLLTGDIQPDSGTITRAAQLRMVTFDQKREQLNQNQTLWQALAPDSDSVVYKGQPIHVAAWAKRFLFPNDQLHQSVSRLSGGEQARVLIANLMLKPADILLLDEPTNDLDIPTLEVLEENLGEFPGAIVLITHDRFLLDRLSDKILYLNGKGKAEFFADYAQCSRAMTSTPASIQKASLPLRKKLSYEDQKELSRLPARIQKAEAELAELQTKLTNPEIIADSAKLKELCDRLAVIQAKVEQLYGRWQELENK